MLGVFDFPKGNLSRISVWDRVSCSGTRPETSLDEEYSS